MPKKQKTAAEIAAEKKNENAAPSSSAQETKVTADPNKKVDRMSLDSKVTMARLINDEWLHGNNVNGDIKENSMALRDAYMADAIVTDIAQGHSLVSRIIGTDEEKYAQTRLLLANMGIALPDFKALPQPSEEELEAQGIKLLPSQTRVINVDARDVDEKVVEQKKKELKSAEKATTDPTKIENEKQLHDALVALLTSVMDTPDKRIQRAINFYQSYLKIQANKIEKEEEKNAELEKINNTSRIDILKSITEVVGDSPFIFSGIGKIYCGQTAQTGSPISAFCLHRRAATNNKTGIVDHDDQFIADIVKTIITWTCNSVINGANQTIAEQKRAIEKRKGDGTHKKAAETVIKACEDKIVKQQQILDIVNNPSFDIVDSLKDGYKSEDENSESYKSARRLVRNIMDTYHKGVDVATVDEDSLLHNCAQRGGVILNLFRGPLAKNNNYSEANIGELKIVAKPEEKAEEEKNA